MNKDVVLTDCGAWVGSKIAREVDALTKSLPKTDEYAFCRKSTVVDVEAQFLDGEKADVAMITTRGVDLEGDIVLPENIQRDLYNRNPIVLFNHDAAHPIGTCEWIKPKGNGLIAKTRYSKRPDQWMGVWEPEAVFELVKQKVLRGKSIGFLPTKIRPVTDEEAAENPKAKRVIEEAVLFEYSTVSVPCNTDAIIEAVSKGFNCDAALLAMLGVKTAPKTVKVPLIRRAKKAPDVDALLLAALENMDPDRVLKSIRRG